MGKGWVVHRVFVTLLAAFALFGYGCSFYDGWTQGRWDVPFKGTAVGNALEFWLRGPEAVGLPKEAWAAIKAERAAMFREEDDWKTWLVLNGLFQLPTSWTSALPRLLQCWLRNMLATYVLYFGAAFVWVYYAYWVWGRELYNGGKDIPSWKAVRDQIHASVIAIPGYAALPTVTEALIENGYTLVYPRLSAMGIARFAAIFCLYISLVEFGVYWAHRLLHDMNWGYRLLHSIHHKYNKENTLSPFASLAFHWVDGVCQGASYCLLVPMVPMHFMTHELLLFFTGLWTTNIHDCLHVGIMPIMGAGYHTIHHTTYKHNYGHYTIYFDYLYGTLTHPEDFEGIKKLEEKVYEELAKEQGVSTEEFLSKAGSQTPVTARHSPNDSIEGVAR